jgi:iron complex outermembrane receptor protein
MLYATFSRGAKSGGINLAGIPVDANGNIVLTTAVIKPESVTSYELGVKNQFFANKLVLNVDIFDTEIKDYQVNVVDSGPVRCAATSQIFRKSARAGSNSTPLFAMLDNLSGYLSGAYTEGKYVEFANGPCPLELIGNSTSACNLSASRFQAFPNGRSPVAVSIVYRWART